MAAVLVISHTCGLRLPCAVELEAESAVRRPGDSGPDYWGIMLLKVAMDVYIDVPEEVARQFTAEPGGIARAAVEALAAEGVRSGKLTVYQARQLLGIRSRYEMDGFLKARGLFLPDTMQEVVSDSQTAIAFLR